MIIILLSVNMNISELIKNRCNELNITFVELAEKIGTTKQNLCNKMARNNLKVSDLEIICKALDLEIIIKGK